MLRVLLLLSLQITPGYWRSPKEEPLETAGASFTGWMLRVRFAGGGGFGGFNPPNDFFDPPPSLHRFELLGGRF